MNIEYNTRHDDIISAFEHLKLPMSYNRTNTQDLLLIINNEKIIGLENILKTLKTKKSFENKFHENFLNDEIIKKTISIHDSDQNELINKFLRKNNTDCEILTFADLVLFFKIYRSSSIKLNKNEAEWIKSFKIRNNITLLDFEQLEIRVGKILKIWDHPNANSLYVEEVDIGRKIQVVSGLKNIIDKSLLEGRCFLFMISMKKSKLRGEVSEGMILCAIDDNLITPIYAPVDKPGEILYVGAKKNFIEPKKLDKNNEIFKNLMNELIVKDHKIIFRGDNVYCDDKVIVCDDIKNGIIS
ncbi:Tyrosine--tRNA ligase, cytoplasmic [Dictyocoela muelleri]|nr:Tyrosine--tRNA ligase, cytoplasmic [Dictyocoela muelleri]